MSHVPLLGRPLPKALPVFHVYLQPNQSLSSQGFAILSITITALAVGLSAFLLMTGLWVGAIFLTFNLAFLLLAFVLARRDRQRAEEVIVEDGHLTVRHYNFRGEPVSSEQMPIYGLTLHRDHDPDYGLLSLQARLRQKRIEIARDLSPAERQDVAVALGDALRRTGCAPRTSTKTALPLHQEVK